jgi:hypothetical protein
MRMRLTKRGIDAIKPGNKRFDVWDTELPNFALRVQPDGSKSFFVRYRLRGLGRRSPKRFVTIGAYGVLTLDQARAQARSIFGDVAKGQDPVIGAARPKHRQPTPSNTSRRNTLHAKATSCAPVTSAGACLSGWSIRCSVADRSTGSPAGS